MHGMKLVEGQGNEYQGGRPLEDDRFNTVYVLVCFLPSALPVVGAALSCSGGLSDLVTRSFVCML